MQSDSNTSTLHEANTNPNDTSMDPSIAAFAMELEHGAKGKEETLSSNNYDKPPSLDASMRSSSVESTDQSRDQRNAESVE